VPFQLYTLCPCKTALWDGAQLTSRIALYGGSTKAIRSPNPRDAQPDMHAH